MTPQVMQELATFEMHLPALLNQHQGEFVVIKGPQMVHFAPSYEAALTWAYEQYGVGGFFVKQVVEDAAIAHLSRDLGPCP